MNYQPLLRDYRQMVRIVRDKANSATSFKLGNAYGKQQKSFSDVFTNNGATPTELQIRTLNEINVPSTSIRRPEAPAEDGYLSSRESSTLYHDLNNTSKQYLNALGGDNGVRRSDGQPGTKLRTQLGTDSFATKVYAQHGFSPQNNHFSKEANEIKKTPETKNKNTKIFQSDSTISNQTHAKPVPGSFNAFN